MASTINIAMIPTKRPFRLVYACRGYRMVQSTRRYYTHFGIAPIYLYSLSMLSQVAKAPSSCSIGLIWLRKDRERVCVLK